MRIDRIHIDGFGHFFDRSFEPHNSPVTVFYGANEAGKSTLLAFMRAILFGFPDRNGRLHYPPLSGGTHGGRITLADSAGKRYIVSRRQGAGVGPVTVTTDSGQPLEDGDLAELLGHHSSGVFKNIFAFTIDELHSEDFLSNSELNGQIYSAGMGVATLPNALTTIETARTSIFRSNGRSQKIYHAVQELREIDSQLQEVAENASRYGNLTGQLQQIGVALDAISVRRRKTQAELNHQNNLRNGWDDWNSLVSAEGQLANMPAEESFPVDGISRLNTLQERVDTARNERDTVAQQVDMARADLDTPIENSTLLDRADDIRIIQEYRGAHGQSIHDLPQREEELEGYRKALAATLKNLGPDWDEERLETFDISIPVRDRITRFGEELRSAAENVERIHSEQRQDAYALEEAEAAQVRSEQAIADAERPTFDTVQIGERRTLIRTTRAKLSDLARVNQRAGDLRTQLNSLTASTASDAPSAGRSGKARTVVTVLSFVLGIVLLIGGALAGEGGIFFGFVASASLFGIAVYLYVSRPQSADPPAESPMAAGVRNSLQHAEQEAQDVHADLIEEAAPLALDTVDDAMLINAETILDRQAAQMTEWIRLEELLANATAVTSRCADRVDDSARRVSSAEQSLDDVRGEWRGWLRQKGVRDTITPETAGIIRTEVESGLDRLATVRSQEDRIEAIKTDICEYTETIAPLAEEFGIVAAPADTSAVASAADRLIELYTEVQQAAIRRDSDRKEYAELVGHLKMRDRQLKDASTNIDKLLAVGNASDPEAFRAKADLQRKRTDLQVEVRTARNRLQRLSGPGDTLDLFTKALQDTDAEAIAGEIRRLEDRQKSIDSEMQELSTKRGNIETELQGLSGEEESSALRMKRGILLEQIHDHARDWAKLTLAHNLLTEARRKFELERQPNVLQHAQTFFKEITDGRYKQVYAPLGQQSITVTDANGIGKTPDNLSRGTREQVFLSLRFGLIRELGERTEPLPVVVDEIMVNFDPERALRAACGFVKLAESNQVLVFTCHPTTIDLFKEASKQVNSQAPEIIKL